jgi:molybdopterin-guanine dinucleotide biosynthesis protein A
MVHDRHSGTGGLAGVDAALAWGEGRRDVLVVAWDMPFVPPALLQSILDHAARSKADVTLPESHSPYGFEPFCAYYSIRVAARLARFLAAGGGAAREFLNQVVLNRIPVAEVERHGDSAALLLSVNTPEDLARAAAIGKRERHRFG